MGNAVDERYYSTEELERMGFRDVRMHKAEDGEVWELTMKCPSNVHWRTSSNTMKQLRRIADQGDCPISPGKLVAVVARGKVVAAFTAPPPGPLLIH